MKDVITFEELMKELEKHRGMRSRLRILSEQQKEFLIKCRENVRPVSYKEMTKLWKRAGWDEITESTIRN